MNVNTVRFFSLEHLDDEVVKQLQDDLQATFSIDDFKPFWKHLLEESPRGCIVAAQGKVDELLRELLAIVFASQCDQGLSQNRKRELFKSPHAPLQSSSNLILMSHSLGLITEQERDILTRIKAPRNPSAHDAIFEGFDKQQLETLWDTVQSHMGKGMAILIAIFGGVFVMAEAFQKGRIDLKKMMKEREEDVDNFIERLFENEGPHQSDVLRDSIHDDTSTVA